MDFLKRLNVGVSHIALPAGISAAPEAGADHFGPAGLNVGGAHN
jgi:hypothetical protein